MVRLEALHGPFSQGPLERFNSYMVRLEEFHASFRSEPKLFQFLYGAIGSSFNTYSLDVANSFNSYMVRLEV